MAWVILCRYDNDPEVQVYGPFDTLEEVDTWQGRFCDVAAEYAVDELRKEPRGFTNFREGILAAIQLKLNIEIDDPGFDFLGYWQAGISPKETVQALLERNKL